MRKKKLITPLSLTEILTLLIAVYCVAVIVCNIFEMKTLGNEKYAIAGGGIFVSWIAFLIMDIITEIWGYKKAIKIFTFAAFLNLVTVLIAWLIIIIPGKYNKQNKAFRLIFSNGPRTVTASMIGFWIGNFLNSFSMEKMRLKTKKPRNAFLFCLRAVISSIIGQLFDNFLFMILAFAPIGLSVFEMKWIDIITSVLIGTSAEIGVEAVFIPLVTRPACLRLLRKKEEEDENTDNGNK